MKSTPSGLCLLLLAALSSCRQESDAPRPNVVFILVDDLGFGDLSCHGAADLKTPRIDALAKQGVRMVRSYAAGPSCTPTRAAFLTGRWPARCGFEGPIPPGLTGPGLPPQESSLAGPLREQGYETALIGKWHLGSRFKHGPRAHGFDHFFGFRSALIDYWTHDGAEGRPDLWENEKRVEVEGYATDLITDRAVDWIGDRTAEHPFFLYVAYNAPHFPYQRPDAPGSAATFDTMRDGTREDYVAMVERLDEGVGKILAALDAAGFGDDTLVVFTNDNGGDDFSINAPLSGGKGHVDEGGIRVPCIARWPGVWPAGKVSKQASITMDWTVTILAAAGALIGDRPLDGMDLTPWLKEGVEPLERSFFWRTERSDRDEHAVLRGDLKLRVVGGAIGVFDVERDIAEKKDLSRREPALRAELEAAYAAWEREMAAERPEFRVN